MCLMFFKCYVSYAVIWNIMNYQTKFYCCCLFCMGIIISNSFKNIFSTKQMYNTRLSIHLIRLTQLRFSDQNCPFICLFRVCLLYILCDLEFQNEQWRQRNHKSKQIGTTELNPIGIQEAPSAKEQRSLKRVLM
jgi:hypothetical protein